MRSLFFPLSLLLVVVIGIDRRDNARSTLRQAMRAIDIQNIAALEHVVFRKGSGGPVMVTEVVEDIDLRGAPLDEKHRFRVLRFDKVCETVGLLGLNMNDENGSVKTEE